MAFATVNLSVCSLISVINSLTFIPSVAFPNLYKSSRLWNIGWSHLSVLARCCICLSMMLFMNSWHVMVGNSAILLQFSNSSRMSPVRRSFPPSSRMGQLRWYSCSVTVISSFSWFLRVAMDMWGTTRLIKGQISMRLMSPGLGSAFLSSPLGYRHSKKAAATRYLNYMTSK